MRIVLATPLYPPDIAEPAPYIKELARRLSTLHEVSIVAYARLPEKVPGVSIVVVNKQKPLPLRLLAYFFALRKTIKNANIIYAENGTSVELPTGMLSFFIKQPLIMHVGDQIARERAQKSFVLKYIERFAFSRAKEIVFDIPFSKPEINPFEPFPVEKFALYEQSWDAHLHALESIFTHAT